MTTGPNYNHKHRQDLRPPVFIVGCPRSGTTLLQSLLISHSDIVSFPETHFFASLRSSRLLRAMGIASHRAKERLNQFLTDIDRADMLCLVPDRTWTVYTYVKIYRTILDRITREQGGRFWVEKTPGHLHFLKEIESYIKDARFIHLIRNGTDTVASLYDVTHRFPEAWGGPRDMDQCIDRWIQDIRISLSRQNDPRHLLVSYEELVARLQKVLESVCQFLDISFFPGIMQNTPQGSKQVILPGEDWKSNVFQPMSNRNNEKFLQVFSTEEQAYIRQRLHQSKIIIQPDTFALKQS